MQQSRASCRQRRNQRHAQLPGTAALAALGAARSVAAFVKVACGACRRGGRGRSAAHGPRRRRGCTGRPGGGGRLRGRSARGACAVRAGAGRRRAAAGVGVCLLDTAVKDGRGLLDWLSPDELASLADDAHDAGLQMALAGALRAEDLPVIRATGADIAGVRSAACSDGRRSGRWTQRASVSPRAARYAGAASR